MAKGGTRPKEPRNPKHPKTIHKSRSKNGDARSIDDDGHSQVFECDPPQTYTASEKSYQQHDPCYWVCEGNSSNDLSVVADLDEGSIEDRYRDLEDFALEIGIYKPAEDNNEMKNEGEDSEMKN